MKWCLGAPDTLHYSSSTVGGTACLTGGLFDLESLPCKQAAKTPADHSIAPTFTENKYSNTTEHNGLPGEKQSKASEIILKESARLYCSLDNSWVPSVTNAWCDRSKIIESAIDLFNTILMLIWIGEPELCGSTRQLACMDFKSGQREQFLSWHRNAELSDTYCM